MAYRACIIKDYGQFDRSYQSSLYNVKGQATSFLLKKLEEELQYEMNRQERIRSVKMLDGNGICLRGQGGGIYFYILKSDVNEVEHVMDMFSDEMTFNGEMFW